MAKINVPTPLGGPPPQVSQVLVKQMSCPNPECDHLLDITDINSGTPAKCENCGNVTILPAYREKWWQRLPVILGGAALTFALGVSTSLTATYVWENHLNVETPPSESEDDKDNEDGTESG